jgi:hypothetical protein
MKIALIVLSVFCIVHSLHADYEARLIKNFYMYVVLRTILKYTPELRESLRDKPVVAHLVNNMISGTGIILVGFFGFTQGWPERKGIYAMVWSCIATYLFYEALTISWFEVSSE